MTDAKKVVGFIGSSFVVGEGRDPGPMGGSRGVGGDGGSAVRRASDVHAGLLAGAAAKCDTHKSCER
ncbi:hypothetical protein GCM10009664_18160 [Kitasatospora gansuensis]